MTYKAFGGRRSSSNTEPLPRFAVMWNDSGYTSLVVPLLIAFPVWHWLRKRSNNAPPYPPGPRAYPLIGNALDFPVSIPLWEGFAKLARQYGMVLLLMVFPDCNIDC